MNIKNWYLLVTMFVISTIIVTGCGSTKSGIVEGKINVMTSFYPLYDFANKIGGEHVNVVNLVETGVDPHDWTPTPKDMVNMTDADLFIYNGLGFEGWVDGFLGGLKSDSKLVVVESSQGISAIAASEAEDEYAEDEHANEEHADEDEHANEEHADEDEHANEEHADEDEHANDEHADEDEHANEEEDHAHGEFDPHVWLSPLQAKKMAENIKDALIEV